MVRTDNQLYHIRRKLRAKDGSVADSISIVDLRHASQGEASENLPAAHVPEMGPPSPALTVPQGGQARSFMCLARTEVYLLQPIAFLSQPANHCSGNYARTNQPPA